MAIPTILATFAAFTVLIASFPLLNAKKRSEQTAQELWLLLPCLPFGALTTIIAIHQTAFYIGFIATTLMIAPLIGAIFFQPFSETVLEFFRPILIATITVNALSSIVFLPTIPVLFQILFGVGVALLLCGHYGYWLSGMSCRRYLFLCSASFFALALVCFDSSLEWIGCILLMASGIFLTRRFGIHEDETRSVIFDGDRSL